MAASSAIGGLGVALASTIVFLVLIQPAAAQIPAHSDQTNDIALGDVDGDGDLDALCGNWSLNRLYLNDGSGLFSDATPNLPPDSDYTLAVALGDVDGDGDVDAWIGNLNQNRLYENDGGGSFADATASLPLVFDWTEAVALGDVDGDGDLDALCGNWGPNRLYLNDGSGLFSDATPNLPPDSDYTLAVALGDVDGDGDLDALIGNASEDQLYLNDGSGVFVDASAGLPSEFYNYTRDITLGDVDGDGDLDALIGTAVDSFGGTAGQNHLYLNDGTGAFADATVGLPAYLDYTNAVAFGDLDGDGDLDALIGNGKVDLEGGAVPEQNRLYLNDGSGVFGDASAGLPAYLDYTHAVALGDVDGDGDLDALMGNTDPFDGDQNRLYVNDGTGVFVDASAGLPVSYCTSGTSASGCKAALSAAGTASATASSGFSLSASTVEGAKDGLYFFGTNGRQANSWGNGTSYQCVVPPVVRSELLAGTGTPGLCDGSFTQDLNALWCPTCPKPQKNPGPGVTLQAQLWYRDPGNTSNQTTSLSDALEVCVGP